LFGEWLTLSGRRSVNVGSVSHCQQGRLYTSGGVPLRWRALLYSVPWGAEKMWTSLLPHLGTIIVRSGFISIILVLLITADQESCSIIVTG